MIYRPNLETLDDIDTSLFTSEYEVMLLEDLRVYPEERTTIFGSIGTLDIVGITNKLLDSRHLGSMSEEQRRNFEIMYKEVYNILYDLADWEKINIDTGQLPLIKTVFKRLKGLVK